MKKKEKKKRKKATQKKATEFYKTKIVSLLCITIIYDGALLSNVHA